jgi:chorismate mutase/prephenate dehydratase
VDERLVRALEERFSVSLEIHRLVEGDGTIEDVSEREFLDSIERSARGVISQAGLRAIFSQIAATARAVESPTRVAYLGPEGNFGHQFVQGFFGAEATFLECLTVADVLEQVRRERAVFGVFAFDSSVEGLHLPAIFALAETDLVIVAERTVAAVLCLMSRSGDRKDVQRIYATAAGHAASELFVEREYPQADVHDVRSPVEAAERVMEDAGAAAILPEPTGRHHGLRTVRENVSNEAELKYRFGVVASRPASRTGKDTTCLLFSLDDAPGTLYQVLSHFAERGLNLKRIQSRPVRAASWDYVFYVEVSGHATDRAVVTALEAVKRSTKYLKLLGSFPTES